MEDKDILLAILVFLLTKSYCKCMYQWRTMICCWTSLYFFWQFHSVPVCINGEGQWYAAGHLSVSSNNILLYRYAFWVLDRYIILSFDMYHVFIVHMYVRRLLSDDESVVSVTRREQQLEKTCLTICFLLLFCFVVNLFWRKVVSCIYKFM